MSRSAERNRLRGIPLAALGTALVVVGVFLTLRVTPHEGPHAYVAASSHSSSPSSSPSSARAARPGVRHAFVVNIENKGFRQTWGRHSAAPYLARTLRAKGVLLTQYFGTAHHSLGNYLAQISGQGPDYATQHDCPTYSRFRTTRPTAKPGQLVGDGCVYPRKVGTLPGQLTRAGLTWRGYMQDMARPCQHSRLGGRERWTSATAGEQYASRHNPFVYFRSITARPAYCKSHVRPLSDLPRDLKKSSRTRNLTYITPDLCHDGHDARCADGGPGGLHAANQWFRTWIPKILSSPAFRKDGLLVITADESEGVTEDSRACCGEGVGPNAGQPGIEGPGGGRVGALVISPFTAPGTTSSRAYNHYSLLASVEQLFGLHRLGYARTVPRTFGGDVFRAS